MRTLASFWIPFTALCCIYQLLCLISTTRTTSSSSSRRWSSEYDDHPAAPLVQPRLLRKESSETTTPQRSTIIHKEEFVYDFEDDNDGDLRSTKSTETSSTSSSSNSSDEEAAYWMKHGCFYYENICHSSYQWFFRDNENNDKKSSNNKWQEPFSINLHNPGFRPNRDVLLSNYPRQIHVGNKNTNQQQHCYTSPISHHFVYSSVFNEMIGEFWLRAMTGMYRLFQLDKQHNNGSTEDDENSTTFSPKMLSPQDLQTYLLLYKKGEILNGHRLFSSSVIPSTHAVLPFTSLLDQTNCQCLPKLIMCGFEDDKQDDQKYLNKKAKWEKENRNPPSPAAAAAQGAPKDDPAQKKQDNSVISPTQASNTTTSLTATMRRRQLVPFAEFIYWDAATSCHGIHWMRKEYAKSLVQLQSHVQQHLFGGNDDDNNNSGTMRYLPEMVKERRRSWLSQHARGVNISDSNDDDWKIVGLAQREGRRVWSNLPQILQHCNRRYNKDRIMCVEINVDQAEMSHPIQQAVVHRAINALVGIHGSHLTNAVMMPPGSYLVELLPWIPEFMIYGRDFFRTTGGPTPIGLMFTNTRINHVGIALERSSCPNICPETLQAQGNNNQQHKISDDDMACLWNLYETDIDQLAWATREFVVDPVIFDEFIQRFLLIHDQQQDQSTTAISCRKIRKRAKRQPRLLLSGKEQDFTLFNVQCRNQKQWVLPHQFYTNYTDGDREAARDLSNQLKSAASKT